MSSLCILTPDPAYYEDWSVPAAHYRALFNGDLVLRPWTAPGDLSGFGRILPLLAWGYQRQADAWFKALDAWETERLPFVNPIPTLRWNTDKDYLLDLEAVGIAIVPTIETHGLRAGDLVEAGDRFGVDTLVVKPPISGGADGTYRLATRDPIPFDVLETEMLIQPLIPSVQTDGEFSLFYFEGLFSHAIVKRPASGDFRVQEQFGGREEAIVPTDAAHALARAALSAAPAMPFYARVDMVIGEDGRFLLMELELIEPSLFFEHAPDGGKTFAAVVRGLL
jgi:hypothetical protein